MNPHYRPSKDPWGWPERIRAALILIVLLVILALALRVADASAASCATSSPTSGPFCNCARAATFRWLDTQHRGCTFTVPCFGRVYFYQSPRSCNKMRAGWKYCGGFSNHLEARHAQP